MIVRFIPTLKVPAGHIIQSVSICRGGSKMKSTQKMGRIFTVIVHCLFARGLNTATQDQSWKLLWIQMDSVKMVT